MEGGQLFDNIRRAKLPMGSAGTSQTIRLNGHPINVRFNLYQVLRSILHHVDEESNEPPNSEQRTLSWRHRYSNPGMSPWKYFWIEALCINQEDPKERNG
jgi:hypothetical protein